MLDFLKQFEEVDNLDVVVEFYDPHPGLDGASVRFPERLRLIAVDLVGRQTTLRDAKRAFQGAMDFSGKVECLPKYIAISDGTNMWRATKYR
ncbi:MAG: hypothetical protein ISR99_02340 [Parcubacteria group bacterium]|nr:hypothetical protein [Parcubacteria group bacterium]